MSNLRPHCHIHSDQKLICPKCRSAKGGKHTAEKHSAKQLSAWGKLGGRPKKEKSAA